MLKNKKIACTGTLTLFSRKQIEALIFSLGGINQHTVTKETDYLILGQYTKSLFESERYTAKERSVRSRIEEGNDIVILSENDFLELVIKHLLEIKGA